MGKRQIIDDTIFIIKTALAVAVLMGIAVCLSSILSGPLQERELLMIENEEVMSTAMLELIGMQQLQQFPAKIEIFFLILMVYNLIVIGNIIGYSVHTMRRSFSQSSFIYYYAQVMRMWQYYLITILRTVFSAFVVWGIYIAGVIFASEFLTRGLDSEMVNTISMILNELAVRGTGIVLFMVAIGVLYGIKQCYRMHGVDYGLCLIGISFILGNLYKIPQLIGQKQIEDMVNAQEMMQMAYQLKQIRFLNPFAWLNPFNIHNHILETEVIYRYGAVALGLIVVAGIIFSVRDWKEL